VHAPNHSLQSPFINLPFIFSAIPKQAYSLMRCVAVQPKDTTLLLQRRGRQNAAPKRRQESTRLHVFIVQKTVGFKVNISLPTTFCCYKTHLKVTL